MAKRVSLFLMLCSMSPAISFADDAVARQEAATKEFMQKQTADCVAKVDFSNSIEDNPFAYKSPDVSCDLGLQMPGLPSFGLGSFNLDSCSLLKMVTGDMVDAANDAMRDQVDSIVFQGVEAINDRLGTDEGQGLDYSGGDITVGGGLENDARDAIKGVGRDIAK